MVEGLPVYSIPSRKLKYYPDLRKVDDKDPITEKILLKHKIDIVHITGPWYLGKAMYRVAKKHNMARVHSYHTNLHDMEYLKYLKQYFFLPTFLLTLLSRYIYWSKFAFGYYFTQSHVLTSPSPPISKLLSKKFPDIPSLHIYNGLDISEFTRKPDEKLLASILPFSLKKELPYVLYVGRLGIEKSIPVLIKGFEKAKLNPALKKLQLVIVGDGPQKQKLMEQVQRGSASSSIHFLGTISRSNVLRSGIIKQATLFCTPSLSETYCGMTVIEAISSMTPMLLAEHPSMTTLAKDLAHYFKPNDSDSLAQELTLLLQDEKLYKNYALTLKKNKKHFESEKMTEEYIKAYNLAYEKTRK